MVPSDTHCVLPPPSSAIVSSHRLLYLLHGIAPVFASCYSASSSSSVYAAHELDSRRVSLVRHGTRTFTSWSLIEDAWTFIGYGAQPLETTFSGITIHLSIRSATTYLEYPSLSKLIVSQKRGAVDAARNSRQGTNRVDLCHDRGFLQRRRGRLVDVCIFNPTCSIPLAIISQSDSFIYIVVMAKSSQSPKTTLQPLLDETQGEALAHASCSSRSASPGKKKETNAQKLHISWWLELSALAFSLASLSALIALLYISDERPVSSWAGLSLNAIVSILAGASKASLAFVISTCLSQGKWNWAGRFAGPLIDFDRFDAASRGAWGSIRLLRSMIRQP